MSVTVEFEPKSDLISEVTFLDTSDNKCKLVSAVNPLPVSAVGSSGVAVGSTGHYTITAATTAGSAVGIIGTAVSILITNISTTDDGQVSFDGGIGWYDIPKNYGGIALDSNAVAKIQLTSSDVYVKAKTNTIDAQIITVEV